MAELLLLNGALRGVCEVERLAEMMRAA